MEKIDFQIRLEQPADYRETGQMVREAFWNCYSPGCTEHYLLHVMRGSLNFVPELDFVAVADNRIVGSIVFQKSFVLGDDGNRHDVLTMGPIAVLPSVQRRGDRAEADRTCPCRCGSARLFGHTLVRRSGILPENGFHGSGTLRHPHVWEQIFRCLACLPVMCRGVGKCGRTIFRG